MSVPLRPAGRPHRRSPRNAWLILVAFAIPAALAVLGWSAAPASQAQLAPDPEDLRGLPREARLPRGAVLVGGPGRPRRAPGHRQAGPHPRRHLLPALPAPQRRQPPPRRLRPATTTCPRTIAYFSTDIETGLDGGTLLHQLVPDYRRRCASADCNEWVSIDLPLAKLASSGWAMFKLIPHADTTDGNAQRVVSGWWAYIDNGKPPHTNAASGPAIAGRRLVLTRRPRRQVLRPPHRQQRPALEPADRPDDPRSAAPGSRPSASSATKPSSSSTPPSTPTRRTSEPSSSPTRAAGTARRSSPSTPPSSPTASTASSSAAATPAPTARTAASSSSPSSSTTRRPPPRRPTAAASRSTRPTRPFPSGCRRRASR